MKKIPIFIISLFLAGSFLTLEASAETDPSQCPTTNPAETVECVSGKHYAGGLCRLDSEIQTKITECQTSGMNEEYQCSSHSCVCAPGFPVDCRLKPPTDCLASPEPENPVCTAAGKTTTECGECGSIIPCSAGYERGTDNECYPIDEFSLFEELADLIYGTNLVAESLIGSKTTIFNDIIANITANASYYFLTPTNGTGTEYKYGLAGDPGDALLLEADYADEAGTISIGIGAAGQVLTINIDGDGTEWSDAIDITGGTAGQVLTINIDEDGTKWTTPAAGGVAAQWVGFTASSYNGNQGGYSVADALCIVGHVCTVQQILYIINNDPDSLPTDAIRAWVNGGPPGYTEQANDCVGWTSLSSGSFGRYWKFDDDTGWLANCSGSYQFACCQ